MSKITITKTTSSNLAHVDFDNLPFGQVFADHMFVADYDGQQWTNMEIKPFGRLTMHPSMLALHYGQSIFEGMKAFALEDKTPVLYRPERHAARLNASATRLCMPEFPEETFVEVLEMLLRLDHQWIPSEPGSALYIRPFMFATDETIGVRPSEKYRLIIFTQPTGPYYAKPVKLLAEHNYIRAANGGTGEAKAAGNYAGSLLPAKIAKAKGYDQVLWLDATDFEYIQEVGTMNIFFVIGDKVITPATDGSILRGITRDSFLTLLTDAGYTVEQRPLGISEVEDAYDRGELKEVFGAGTAAVVAKVCEIKNKDKVMKLSVEDYKVAPWLYDQINGIRNGSISDKHGWLHPVALPVSV